VATIYRDLMTVTDAFARRGKRKTSATVILSAVVIGSYHIMLGYLLMLKKIILSWLDA
jgi:hypothetical protein